MTSTLSGSALTAGGGTAGGGAIGGCAPGWALAELASAATTIADLTESV
jgi:hypothetical protein